MYNYIHKGENYENNKQNDRKLFSEIVKKHGLKKEGILLRLFKRKLKDKLKDKDFQKDIKDGDKKLDDIKKE